LLEFGENVQVENTIKVHLANLKTEGRLKRVGSDRGGYWMVILHDK